jgi:hypothetical protein
MALEAVVFPRQHLACGTDEVAAAMSMHAPSLGRGVDDIDEFEEKGGVVLQEEAASATMYIAGSTAWAAAVEEHWDEKRFYPPVPPPASSGRAKAVSSSSAAAVRKRRRRPKAVKNREETESQRRNHIAVERNRRRQMNDYLSVLRSAMPPSYAQRVRTYMPPFTVLAALPVMSAVSTHRCAQRTDGSALSLSAHRSLSPSFALHCHRCPILVPLVAMPPWTLVPCATERIYCVLPWRTRTTCPRAHASGAECFAMIVSPPS